MGYYLQTPENLSKAEQLIEMYGATRIYQPRHPAELREIPKDKALICVVENGPFDAAAVVYSQQEWFEFADPTDIRLKHWLLMDSAKVDELVGTPVSESRDF